MTDGGEKTESVHFNEGDNEHLNQIEVLQENLLKQLMDSKLEDASQPNRMPVQLESNLLFRRENADGFTDNCLKKLTFEGPKDPNVTISKSPKHVDAVGKLPPSVHLPVTMESSFDPHHYQDHHHHGAVRSIPPSASRGIVSSDNASKVALADKQASNVYDVKAYYEEELDSLRNQISVLQNQMTGEKSSNLLFAPRTGGRLSLSPSRLSRSPLSSKAPLRSPVKSYVTPYSRSPHKSVYKSSTEEVNSVNTPGRYHVLEDGHGESVSDQMSVVLQNRLDEERRRLQEVQSLRRKLEEEVSQLKSDLARQEQDISELHREKKSVEHNLQQVLMELETSYHENRELHAENMSLVHQLHDSDEQQTLLRAHVRKLEIELQNCKSTVAQLEDEMRQFHRKQNRDHSMSSQQTFRISTGKEQLEEPGWETPVKDVSQRRTPPQPHTVPAARDRVTKVDTRNLYHTSGPTASSKTTPLSSSLPVSRRKWLESSDAGLITGIPAYRSSTPQTDSVQYYSTSSPPLKYSSSDLTTSALEAVRRGQVMAKEAWHPQADTPPNSDNFEEEPTSHQMSFEEKVKEQLKEVAEAEKRLDKLRAEKQQLESVLNHIPRRTTMQLKSKRMKTEQRLEEVDREIGHVRIFLRSHRAL
jgi:hypothetical protein